jgi:phosphoribosylformylglycinamidine synthase subunit PurQ / glutaminase
MNKPKILILAGYGINCDDETKFAFDYAGGESQIIHINDLIEKKSLLKDYQIFVFPGGFSYGDDTGSGLALANRIKNNLIDELTDFINRDTLMLGICNGFQAMVNIGVIPAFKKNSSVTEVALKHNKTFRYQCRWVDLKVNKNSPSIFTKGIDYLHIPIAHAEGNFYADEETILKIENENLSTLKYIKSHEENANGEFPFNPNGSINDIASICNSTGRIMGMMPHPERGIFSTQREDWTLLKEEMNREGKSLPHETEGVKIFKNAVNYFL